MRQLRTSSKFELQITVGCEAKKDTRAKERAVNTITDELVYTACCRLVNYYNCEVPAIFRLALVHQRYIPIPTCRHCAAILNSAGHRQ